MDGSERHELADIRLNLASLTMQLVLLRLRREERANPRWYLQPRVPAGNPRGGQWTDAALPALWQLLRLAPGAVEALRKLARGVRGWLSRPPRRWSGRPSEERDFNDETQRIGRPTERRPEHAQLRFRSFREFKEIVGPAGEGFEWHHLVEQRLADNGRFAPEEIHNTDNIVRLRRDVHICVNATMSSIQRYSHGKTVRMWLESMSFEKQFNLALDIIDDCLRLLGRSADETGRD